MKNKIIFSIFISLSISIFVIIFLDSIYPEPDTDTGHEFYFESFDQKKERIFVFGSSNMGQLNSTLVNEIVSNSDPSFEVYNLAISSDEPSSRLPHLERTILLEPTLVIYGITYRDFLVCGYQSDFGLCTENDPFLLPDVKKSIEANLPKEIQDNKLNPAFTTLRIIRDGLGESQLFTEQNKIRLPNSPFYYIDPKLHHTIIEFDEELKKQSNVMKNQGVTMDVTDNGKDVKALKTIIKSLKENNIDVILYTMPQNGPYYLDNLSTENKEGFNQMIDRISSEFKIPVYDFTEKYSEKKVWADITHVSFNSRTMIFSEDFAKIILEEIEQ